MALLSWLRPHWDKLKGLPQNPKQLWDHRTDPHPRIGLHQGMPFPRAEGNHFGPQHAVANCHHCIKATVVAASQAYTASPDCLTHEVLQSQFGAAAAGATPCCRRGMNGAGRGAAGSLMRACRSWRILRPAFVSVFHMHNFCSQAPAQPEGCRMLARAWHAWQMCWHHATCLGNVAIPSGFHSVSTYRNQRSPHKLC